MLGYSTLKVNGATCIDVLGLPLEVYLSILVLGVSIGHCGSIDDILSIAVT